MGERRVVAERVVGAPAEEVYGYIADDREHHRRFLPPAFTDVVAERGGRGAGTVARFRLTVGGRGREYRAVNAEPEPGRVLTEANAGTGSTTTFTVTPAGAENRVRVETAWPGLWNASWPRACSAGWTRTSWSASTGTRGSAAGRDRGGSDRPG